MHDGGFVRRACGRGVALRGPQKRAAARQMPRKLPGDKARLSYNFSRVFLEFCALTGRHWTSAEVCGLAAATLNFRRWPRVPDRVRSELPGIKPSTYQKGRFVSSRGFFRDHIGPRATDAHSSRAPVWAIWDRQLLVLWSRRRASFRSAGPSPIHQPAERNESARSHAQGLRLPECRTGVRAVRLSGGAEIHPRVLTACASSAHIGINTNDDHKGVLHVLAFASP